MAAATPSLVVDTTNALTDFDFCLAVSEAALNAMVPPAWESWKRHSHLVDRFSSCQPIAKGSPVGASVGVEDVAIEPPVVCLNVRNAQPGDVKVIFSLPSGTVRYLDDNETLATAPIDNWTIAFVSRLGMQPVDLGMLETIDPNAHRQAQALIETSAFGDEAFSIEYLFLKLTEVDLMQPGSCEVEIPESVPVAARDQTLRSLNAFLQGRPEEGAPGREFMLGTVVRRTNRHAVPTFALTDIVLDLHRDPAAETGCTHDSATCSTLAYLGEFVGRPLPTALDAARMRLADAWVRPSELSGEDSEISGVMAISKRFLFDGYLVPLVKGELERQFDGERVELSILPDGKTWVFSGHREHAASSEDIIERRWKKSSAWSMAIAVDVATNMTGITGRIDSSVNYDGYTLRFLGLGHYHTEWMHNQGHRTLKSTLTFDMGASRDFSIKPRLAELEFSNLAIDNKKVVGGATVLEAFGAVEKALGLVGATPEELLESAMRRAVDGIEQSLKKAAEQIAIDVTQHAFIPPGGGVFTLQRPRFSEAGDLLLDVIYKYS